jgi:trk system potassium uptake protein TrkA
MVACMLAKRYGAKTTVARVRNPEYIEIKDFSLNELMGIDLIINPEHVTAMEIAEIVKFPEALNVNYFANGKIQLLVLELEPDSPLVDKEIKSFNTLKIIKLLSIVNYNLRSIVAVTYK